MNKIQFPLPHSLSCPCIPTCARPAGPCSCFRAVREPWHRSWRRVAQSGSSTRSRMDPRERVSIQLQGLTSVAMQWRPRGVVCSWAGGMNWGVAGMHLLEDNLILWAGNLALPVTNYPAPRVRAALAGKPNASKDALAYSVMVRLNLIGEYRSAPEWEAIAAGYHHLQDCPNEDLQPNSSC